jgi:hypothetical protein
MKKIIIFAIIVIVLLNTILVVNQLIKSHKTEQYEKWKYEAELNAIIKYEGEEIKALQNASNQYEKLQYELMCHIIEENSEYYENFSKKFINEFEKYGYDEYYESNGRFSLGKIQSKLENEINRVLLGYDCYINNEIGITFVTLKYPVSIKVFGFSNGSTRLDSYECTIFYIPDEYMNEETIAALNTNVYYNSLEHIKDNLFIKKQMIMNY